MNSLPILYGDVQRWALVQADTLELLPQLPAASVDAVVTDPPYGISFADAKWDAMPAWALERFVTGWGAELLRVLKPGGHVVAFGAPRTVHRLVSGLEEAGLEIRDQLMWLYGQGTPKSRKLPGGRGTTLKPAYEPIVLARAPLAGSLMTNLDRYDTGALEIDAGRIPNVDAAGSLGRWPANLALSHSRHCTNWACDPECPVRLLDQSSPVRPSRFFYCAKASPTEKEAGCEALPAVRAQVFGMRRDAPSVLRRNPHPTVKPIELMRWLVRLICPPGGVVLDPFAGSGSTGAAAVLEGRQFLGIEREAQFTAVARARLAHWSRTGSRPL